MAKETPKHIITVARAIGTVEQITVQMQADSPDEFKSLVLAAEDAIQPRADQFQKQLEESQQRIEAEMASKEEAAAAKKGKQ